MAATNMTPPPHAPAFLDRAGWGGGDIRPLAGDASFRRYFRVHRDGDSAVLMDAPPEHEDSRPFLAVAEHLAAIGFRAPRVLARDLEAGLILLEDFGDDRMKEAIEADPAAETPIYAQAIDLLADLHGHAAGPLPPYDMAVYQREAGLFPEWYMPAVGLDADAEGCATSWAAAWDAVLAPIAADRSVSVLRDYHAENIMLLGDGSLGLLDFQDALAGHPAYDLVSLLQDARRDVPPDVEAAMIARYAARRPFDEAAYALLGAQRNAKILGIFTRLWKRDGKPRYLAFQPRVWGYLERDLAHPALAPVKAWFDAHVPPAQRAAHWTDHII
ncbi:aminoglycoside phosphotransferase family protein [Rhizorhabdus histidinilytica]|uniref:aminoglycoside phosphotransferase family protein n=1 Tax=Rhizorhabdus histidinilytica TaxID=439228 RepID=UPI003D3015AB